MERKIYILGASGFAKEVYGLLVAIGDYTIMAFVDKENGPAIEIFNKKVPVISEEELLEEETSETASLIIGIGEPQIIKRLSKKFDNFHFPNCIHPTAIIEESEISLGRGNIITAGVIFTVSTKVNDFNIFNLSTTVGHDVSIGSCNVINPGVNISGGVKIGDGNLIGVGSIILQNKGIKSHSVIGASSLVTKNVDEHITVMGVPAKEK